MANKSGPRVQLEQWEPNLTVWDRPLRYDWTHMIAEPVKPKLWDNLQRSKEWSMVSNAALKSREKRRVALPCMSCASADRQQTDSTAIKTSQWGILNIPKFRTATKMATTTIWRLVWLTTKTVRPYWDTVQHNYDLTRFGLKTGHTAVAVCLPSRCDWSIVSEQFLNGISA